MDWPVQVAVLHVFFRAGRQFYYQKIKKLSKRHVLLTTDALVILADKKSGTQSGVTALKWFL